MLLGEEIDRQVKEYLKYLREQGSTVNMVIAIPTAEGVVRSVDANLVYANGGMCVSTPQAIKTIHVK